MSNIRADVVSLLVDMDDPTGVRSMCHRDGRPLTAAEFDLLHDVATLGDLRAALDYMQREVEFGYPDA